MDIKQALKLFNLAPNAPPAAFKKRYHDLAAAWHPDLHAQDSRLQEQASERMKEINAAYDTICTYINGHLTVACDACGAENRKRADVNLDYAACSACGKQIRKPLLKKKRIPCGNPRCAGTIGTSGRCTYCGKTIAEGRAGGFTNSHSRKGPQPARGIGVKRAAFAVAVFCGVLLCLYAYRYELYHLNGSVRAAAEFQTVAPDLPKPIVPPPQNEPAPSIRRSGSQPVAKDDIFYAALFRDSGLRKEDAVRLQQILETIGYGIGKRDGVIRGRTLACFKQYCIDFGYIPSGRFPDCFFENSLFHYQVAREHRDWLSIYLTDDLENWIHALPEDRRRQIRQLALDRPGVAIQLIRRYKFEKFKPLPAALPETGILRKNFSEAAGQLKIGTQTESNNYFIKFVEQATGQETASAFIRSGSALSMHLPPGGYELRYAAGRNWYGWEYLFGTSTSYGRLPQPIVVAHKPHPLDARAIELIPAQHGRLAMDIISEYDF